MKVLLVLVHLAFVTQPVAMKYISQTKLTASKVNQSKSCLQAACSHDTIDSCPLHRKVATTC